ncbi:murein L,D-transpeptidase family protein [Xanthobacteraceae bacterium Astr-EGSB]|uniref:L,D-transpeptidase family protein n=1 Tax=Astrobacterium formosum TaxID=3069710 RepID=UPI0027B1A6C6|nr:murein L,D-transpeptidase family protein [Xanthobacteraceae bacterium Astr-EGSB]
MSASRLTARPRALLASVALLAAVALAGCQTDGSVSNLPAKALKPVSAAMRAELEKKQMPLESPILVRIFKEEAELEVWKQDANGQFALLKTYPICRWSGELGPKIKQGDRQAPEGFYAITPGQMNPNSSYYLSFNLGFPNAFDRAYDRTGQFLMVHGDCSSAGCYAMTDEQMGEIYALGRESFFGGQKSFQVQAYPFRMTPLNMAKHRNSPHMAFWKMLKEGNDHFELTRAEPKVDVCERRYVFNAQAPTGDPKPLAFNARAKCPTYEVAQEIATAVAEKQEKDQREFVALVQRGTQTVAVTTGNDGGMHPTFAAKLKPGGQFDQTGRFLLASSDSSTPPLPPTVNPPKNLAAGTDIQTGTTPERPAPVRTATAEPPGSNSNFFGSLFSDSNSTVSKMFGLRGGKDDVPPPPNSKPAKKTRPAQASPARPATPPRAVASSAPGAVRPPAAVPAQPPTHTAAAAPAKPASMPPTATALAPMPAPSSGMMAGAAPVMSSSNFESRWGAFR